MRSGMAEDRGVLSRRLLLAPLRSLGAESAVTCVRGAGRVYDPSFCTGRSLRTLSTSNRAPSCSRKGVISRQWSSTRGSAVTTSSIRGSFRTVAACIKSLEALLKTSSIGWASSLPGRWAPARRMENRPAHRPAPFLTDRRNDPRSQATKRMNAKKRGSHPMATAPFHTPAMNPRRQCRETHARAHVAPRKPSRLSTLILL